MQGRSVKVFEYFRGFNSTLYLTTLIAFIQGMIGLSGLAVSYMFKDDLKVQPGNLTFYQSLMEMGWIIKPLYGFISDGFPIGGQRRKPYLYICSLANFGIWLLMGLAQKLNVATYVSILCMQSISMAFINVMGEALMVEISQQVNDTSQNKQKETVNSVSLFFGARSLGYFITAYVSGIILEHTSKYTVFLITSSFPLVLLFSTYFLKEDKINVEFSEKDRNQRIENIKKLWEFVKQKEIYQPITVIFIFVATPSTGSIMFYYLTNELHFNEEFMGRLRVISSLASIIGIFLYNKFFSNTKFKQLITWTTLIAILMSLAQIILVTRKNVELGIPDGLFCFSDNLLSQVFGEIMTMPILVLACQICPKNIEGTMYALLMSIINLGGMVSDFLGGILIMLLGLSDKNFENLTLLIVITSLSWSLPLLLIFSTDFDKSKQIAQCTRNVEELPLGIHEDIDLVCINDLYMHKHSLSASSSIKECKL